MNKTDQRDREEVTQALLREWLTYDPNTGIFTWAKSRDRGKVVKGRQAGCVHSDGYIKIRFFNRMYRVSRLAVLYMTGELPAFVDHIDRNRSNDRWTNLRVCTRSQNQSNRSRQANNKSGFKGVFWNTQKQRWVAKIGYSRKQRHLGFFDVPEEAAAAYSQAARELHGDFACTT